MKLLALFLSHLAVAALAVAAYIELSARRGVAAGPPSMPWSGWPVPESDDWATDPYLVHVSSGAGIKGPITVYTGNADPRTAELATGGGQEGPEQ